MFEHLKQSHKVQKVKRGIKIFEQFTNMANRFKNRLGVTGVPPAPLIGERLSAIDYQFMRIKEKLDKELPMLTYDQLAEQMRNELPDEMVLGRLTLMGYYKSACELTELIRQDVKERREVKPHKHCFASMELGKDKIKLKSIAAVFGECELLERQGVWNEIILSRLQLAKSFVRKNDFWLAEKLVASCFEYSNHLNPEKDIEDRYLIADLYLTLAFLLFENSYEEEKYQQIYELLENCRKLTNDIQDRKLIKYIKRRPNSEDKGRDIVQIKLDLPAKLHGWKKLDTNQEVLVESHGTAFHMASILMSLIMIRKAQRMSQNQMEVDQKVEEHYTNAIEFATEGHKHENIINVLYSYGRYLIEKRSMDKAHEIFLNMHFKSMLNKDYIALGIAFNCLGFICYEKSDTQGAVGNLCEEWEIGCAQDSPLLIIDSTRDMGKVLLEEGQFLKAKLVCEESFIQHAELKKTTEIGIKFDRESEQEVDDAFDYSWAMAGIASGHCKWGRFSSLARNDQFLDLLEWKNSRKSMYPLLFVPHHFRTISQESKHRDVALKSRIMNELQKLKDEERDLEPMTAQELYDRWHELVDGEGFQFQHDLHQKNDYRMRVMGKSFSIRPSLGVALQQNVNMSAYDEKSVHLIRKIVRKILIDQQKTQQYEKNNLQDI